VTKVVAFGAFVEILPGVEGLVHISELADHHVESPSEVVEPGTKLNVKILEIDEERRRLSLSIKRVEGQNMPMQDLGAQIAEASEEDSSDADPTTAGPDTASEESEAELPQDDSAEGAAEDAAEAEQLQDEAAEETSGEDEAAEEAPAEEDDDGEEQEGESVTERPDSPDDLVEAAGEDETDES
jgi:small subunit ribosomal protein S1